MSLSHWVRGLQPSHARRRSPANRLGILQLEDRITPDSRDVAGLRFLSEGTFSGSSSNATISTGVQVGLVPAAGATFTPLLDLPAGVTISTSPATATINSTLSARGLTFTGSNLAFAFDQPNDKFSIAGDATFTAGGVTIGASFGSAAGTPGLVIQGGKLAAVDVGITSSFSFGAVSFATEDLRLKLDTGTAASTRYAVSGKATATVQGQSSPITLTTQFGESAAEPGLVVVNGQLTDLTVGISGGFSVAGVTVAAKDLTFAFNQAAKSYALFGSASAGFKNAAVDIGFEALLGTAAQPGVSVVNGKLVALNLGVTSNFDVAGVSVNTKALTFTLDVPRNTYTLAGSAGFSFTGVGAKVDLDVAFGGAGTPGLKVVNGQLTELAVQVNGGFAVAGLSARATDLRFTYNRFFNRYGLSGGLRVSTAAVPGGKRVLDNFAVQLGSAASPGIVVQNGQLQKLDFALNGTVNLGPLQVTPNNLRVQYTRLGGVLQFTGGLTASFGAKFNARGDLTNGGLVINTTTGAVQLNGIKLTVFDTRIGPVNIREAFVEYRTNPAGSFELSGGAIVDLPAGLTVGGTFQFTNGSLQRITLFVEKDPGLPLANTGVFVRRVDATLNNLSTPSALQLSGSVTFTAGPSYKIGTRSVSLVQGTVAVSLDLAANTLRFQGTVSMVGDFVPVAEGSITFTFNPSNPALSTVAVRVGVNLYGGFLKGTLALDLSQQVIVFSARLAVRVPDISIPEVRFPDVDFGPFGIARGGVVIPATNIGGQELGSVEVAGLLNNENPGQSQLTFRATLLGVVDASVLVRFNGQLVVSGTALAVPFGPNVYSLPALFTDAAAPVPGLPTPPPLVAPSVTILAADRVAGSPTNDLRVRYRITSTAQTDLRQITVGFAINDSGPRFATTVLGNLQTGETFDPATRTGTMVLRNPDARATPGQPYRLRPVISDELSPSVSGALFGPINPVFAPPSIRGATTLVVPAVNQPLTVPANTIVIDDPASAFDPAARIRVSVAADSQIRLSVPAGQLPAGVTAEENNGRRLTLVGPTGDVNLALDRLTVTRLFDGAAYSLSVFANRPGTDSSAVSRTITLPANPPALGLTVPPDNRTVVNNFNRSILPYLDATLVIEPGSQITVVRVNLLRGPGPAGREVNDFFDGPLSAVVPAGVTIDATYDRGSRELAISGFLDSETTADFQRVIQSVLFAPISRLAGTLTLRFTLGTFKNGRFQPARVLEERTLTVADPNVLPRSGGPSGKAAAKTTGEQLLVNARDAGGAFTGTGPRVIAPDLTVTNTDAADPVRSATVAFTGLYDATSDVLAFTPAGGITGAFDPATGVLALTGGPDTTTADFRTALRSVTYTSTRKNPTPYPRELTFAVTSAAGVVSDSPLGRVVLELAVPTVPPGVAGTTTPLAVPPNAAPVAVFPDFTLTYPDAALPPPSVPLGTFVPGTTLTRGTVAVATNYVRGEDLLAFTPVGGITGTFVAETGELVLEGFGTLAEYQRAVRSVTYRNRNTSPSTADRAVIVTLDDGSASDNPVTLTRPVRPQSDGLDTVRVSGSLTPLVVTPGTVSASLALTDLNYAPRPGETELVYTILAAPQGSRGTVRLTDGTVAEVGTEVPIEQLRGATFVPSTTPRSGTVDFVFSIAGRNPVTGILTDAPIVATVPIRTTNVAPTAVADAFGTPAGTPLVLTVLENDTDPNVDLLRVEAFTQPANGTVVRTADGSYVYTPNAGFAGADTFTYTVADGAAGTATGTVTVTVAAPPRTNAVGLVGFQEFSAGADTGGGTATLFNPDAAPRYSVDPFPGFAGGVRTAAADFNGDGVADLVVGTGPGRATRVLILDGVTKAELFAVDPFEASFTGGVYVTAGDLNGDGTPDLAITPDEGGGPRVDVYSGAGFGKLASFFGIDDTSFRGGARAATGDLNGDGTADLIVVAGFGGGPRVAGFDGRTVGGTPTRLFGDFFAFEQALRNGIFVAAGDVDGDGFADLIAGGGPGGGPRVTAFSGKDLLNNEYAVRANFFGGDEASRGGIRVAAKDLDGDTRADIVVGAGSGAGSRVTAYFGKDIAAAGTPPAAEAFDAFSGFAGGVFVG